MNHKKITAILTIALFTLMNFTLLIPVHSTPGTFEGIGWKPIAPVRRIFLVDAENSEPSLYSGAFLAAVPAALFYDGTHFFGAPILYYKSDLKSMEYLADDWNSYCEAYGGIEEAILINVAKTAVEDIFPAERYTEITATDIHDLTEAIAKAMWKESQAATLAVVRDTYQAPAGPTTKQINGVYPSNFTPYVQTKVHTYTFTNPAPEREAADHFLHDFTVNQTYQLVNASLKQGPAPVLPPYVYIIPEPGYFDSMVEYATSGGQSGQPGWNLEMPVYNEGQKVGYSGNPPIRPPKGTETWISPNYIPGNWTIDTWYEEKFWINPGTVNTTIYVTGYPGQEHLLDLDPYAENIEVTLSWMDATQNLDLIVRDASGGVVGASHLDAGQEEKVDLTRVGLGDTTVYVVRRKGSGDAAYTITYTYEQYTTQDKADAMLNMAEGAVFASLTNTPLFYVTTDAVPASTQDAMTDLGITSVTLFDVGVNRESSLDSQLSTLGVNVHKLVETSTDAYHSVMDITGRDFHFVATTIHPHEAANITAEPNLEELSEMYFGKTATVDEITVDKSTLDLFCWALTRNDFAGAEYLGQAAYIAAVHGGPVLIVDSELEISNFAAFTANEGLRLINTALKGLNPYRPALWDYEVDMLGGFTFDPYGTKVLEAKYAYEGLNRIGLDSDSIETIVTVASMWDLGPDFERLLYGEAIAGRFGDISDEPADTAVYIARNTFYPALIHQNPGIDTATCSFEIYAHEYNNRIGEGTAPGANRTHEILEHGYKDAWGIYPALTEGYEDYDVSTSELIPTNLEEMGYTMEYHTNLEEVTKGLNSGTAQYYLFGGGSSPGSGYTYFWDPEKAVELVNALNIFNWGQIGMLWANYTITQEYLESLDVNQLTRVDPDPWRAFETGGYQGGGVDFPDSHGHERWFLAHTGFVDPIARESLKSFEVAAFQPDGYVWPRPIENFEFGNSTQYYPGWSTTTAVEFQYNDLTTRYQAIAGYQIEAELDNLHSTQAFLASPKLALTEFPTAFLRHGAVCTVVDYLGIGETTLGPVTGGWGSYWFTLGQTFFERGVGQSLYDCIDHTGTFYSLERPATDWTAGWYLLGDPTLRPYSPTKNPIGEPPATALTSLPENRILEIQPTQPGPIIPMEYIAIIIAVIVVIIVVVAVYVYRKGKK